MTQKMNEIVKELDYYFFINAISAETLADARSYVEINAQELEIDCINLTAQEAADMVLSFC